jgi:hypothetical protein
MNSYHWTTVLLAFLCCALVFLFIGLSFGVSNERERIYNKCLVNNAEKTYGAAIEHCKREVK